MRSPEQDPPTHPWKSLIPNLPPEEREKLSHARRTIGLDILLEKHKITYHFSIIMSIKHYLPTPTCNSLFPILPPDCRT
jgi:hypothetical protein